MPSTAPSTCTPTASVNSTTRFCAAGVGAAFAEVITLPIDIAKVRLQTQAPLADGTIRYAGMLHAMWRIGADDGARALWRGLEPALLRQVCYTGLSFVLYEPVRDAIAGAGVHKEDVPFWKRVLSGGCAGGVAIVVMNPTDVVKTQMQSRARGAPLRIVPTARAVWHGEGIAGFWRGWQPNVARCFVSNAAEIGVYDAAKTEMLRARLLPDGPLAHAAASGVAGCVSAVFCCPVDVVKTRLMNQAGGHKTEGGRAYSSVLNCFARMVHEEGVGSLYKGFAPLATRKVVWTVGYFFVYEQALLSMRGSYS